MAEELQAFERRAAALFQESVDGLDMRIRSRLTQARSAALAAAAPQRRRSWAYGWWPAAGVSAAALLGAVLWMGMPGGHHAANPFADSSNVEDLDLIASTDEASGAPMEMLQDDLDFYDFADKAAAEPAA